MPWLQEWFKLETVADVFSATGYFFLIHYNHHFVFDFRQCLSSSLPMDFMWEAKPLEMLLWGKEDRNDGWNSEFRQSSQAGCDSNILEDLELHSFFFLSFFLWMLTLQPRIKDYAHLIFSLKVIYKIGTGQTTKITIQYNMYLLITGYI